MTRYLIRLICRFSLGCACLVLLMLGIGRIMPPEDEIIFNGAIIFEPNDIYRMSLQRHIDAALTHEPSDKYLVNWSHDGQQIAFMGVTQMGSQIYLMDAVGSGTHLLNDATSPTKSPTWSPDDRYMAYIDETEDYSRLMLFDFQTSDLQPLTDMLFSPDNPAWSPDGTQIAFSSDTLPDEHKNIYTVNIKTRQIQLLAKINNLNMFPAWSPDGKQIVFVSYASDSFGIYSVDVQTGTPELLVSSATNPTFSPDGHYLLYFSGNPNAMSLLDMTQKKSVLLYTDTMGVLNTPNWSSDGRFIFYASFGVNAAHIYKLSVAECLSQPNSCTPERLTDKLTLYDSPRWRPTSP